MAPHSVHAARAESGNERYAIEEQLMKKAEAAGLKLGDKAFAEYMDKNDQLMKFRQMFHMPRNDTLMGVKPELLEESERTADCVYLCGNSLGLQPKGTQVLVNEELDKWQRRGVQGHFDDSARPWVDIAEKMASDLAPIVGAQPHEVVAMNTLTVNLHILMASFYRPTAQRFKILLEKKAFPSDHYAITSQVRFHGYDPETAMILVDGNTESVLSALAECGNEVALVLLPGVQYYLGTVFDISTITRVAKDMGCMVGWDLAHAAGNIELHLHDWDVDFACWCTYKYMNAGPGGIAGAFVHSKHHENPELPRLLGWWSHELKTRFQMSNEFQRNPGANAYAMSNPGVLQCVSLRASLDVFKQTSMSALREKGLMLSTYLILLLESVLDERVTLLTPRDPAQRGCQVSLHCSVPVRPVFEYLEGCGVVCDVREPNVLRLAAVPLYNTFTDVYKFCEYLRRALAAVAPK